MKVIVAVGGMLLAVLAAAQTSTVEVTDAYVRAMPPGRTVTAGFFEIANRGDQDCRLEAAKTDIAGATELHTHIHEDGKMKMRQVPGIDLPAGEQLSFKPGGLHVMLFRVRPLKDGEPVEMVLEFADCDPVVVQAEVRSIKRK
ncbi:copper chaperone PCu(A)C [Porticoccus sp. W117]|uniref:copper chaperone PCu(A)C n=1 Tax=Porticoccus sp. W117 TaxID=3054777 RepID=UPI0025961D81|nr:copper chaperone PCu(A)C [Porticoccus sp. W117]MDM3871445.1 copper chaperone PCu(A)C [Porticoccus sp. W117]